MEFLEKCTKESAKVTYFFKKLSTSEGHSES